MKHRYLDMMIYSMEVSFDLGRLGGRTPPENVLHVYSRLQAVHDVYKATRVPERGYGVPLALDALTLAYMVEHLTGHLAMLKQAMEDDDTSAFDCLNFNQIYTVLNETREYVSRMASASLN